MAEVTKHVIYMFEKVFNSEISDIRGTDAVVHDLAEILFRYDPLRINFDNSNKGEYFPESISIAENWDGCDDVDSISELVNNILSDWFYKEWQADNEEFRTQNKMTLMCSEIFNLYKNYKGLD